jgi:tetratricopeptide (TPR) repeat protein
MTMPPLIRRLAPAAAGGLAFGLYLLTLAPSVDFIDSGELSAAAWTFGIAHPTGYPLFTLLAGAWSHLPFGGSVIGRLNLLAAAWCAVAVGLLVVLIQALLAVPVPHPPEAAAGRRSKKSHDSRPLPWLDERWHLVMAIFGALAVGLSETFWKTALSIEVYSLHLVFLALVLWLFVRAILDPPADARLARRWWLAFAFAAGLSFTNHMTTILLAPACLALLVWQTGWNRALWNRLVLAAPAFLAGLLPYLYLPFRAAAHPALNWGDPENLERFLRHVSGKQYRVWMFSGADVAGKQLGHFLSSYPAEFAYVLLPLVLLGAWAAFRRQPPVGWLLALLFGSCVAYAVNYDIHDIDSYFLLAYAVSGIWAAYGLAEIARRTARRPWLPAALGVAVLLAMGGIQMSRVSERGNYLVEDYTRNMFRSLRPGAVILSSQWDYWVSAGWYYRQVEGLRPDVTVIDPELLRRSWYLEQLQRQHPWLYARSEREIRDFAAQLDRFEKELPYDPGEIEARYTLMINSFLDRNAGDHPLYVTFEVAPKFGAAYRRIPEGLAFRLYRPDALPSPDAPVWDEFAFRPFRRDEPLADNLVGFYGSMLANRGIFLHESGRYQAAARLFDRALVFNPDSKNIREWQSLNSSRMDVKR